MTRINKAVCAAMLLATVLHTGCGDDEPAPVQAARAYMEAMQARDVSRLLELIDVQAVASLEQAATRASDQLGGRRTIAPSEMLQIVDPDERFTMYRLELVTADEATAQVRVIGAHDAQLVLDLRLEDDGWRVDMPPLVANAS